MASLILRRISCNRWALFSTDGTQISSTYIGNSRDVKKWADCWCSSWPNWYFTEEVNEYETKDRISE